MCSEPEMISITYFNLLKKFPDFTLNIIEALFRMRADMDNDSIHLAMEECKKMWDKNPKPTGPIPETVVSRLSAAIPVGKVTKQLNVVKK